MKNIISEYSDLRDNKDKILSFPSGKGGVGKTAVTLNLAAALALKGKKPLLMDLNLALPNIQLFVDTKPNYTLTHYLSGNCELSEVVGKVNVKDTYFGVIPSKSLVDLKQKIDVEELSKVMLILRGEYDYLLLDLAPASSKYVLFPISISDRIFIVTSDTIPAHMDVMRLIEYLEENGVENEGLIVNMVKKKREHLIGPDLNIFTTIPYDKALKGVFQEGKTVFDSKVSLFSSSKKRFESMADQIMEKFP